MSPAQAPPRIIFGFPPPSPFSPIQLSAPLPFMGLLRPYVTINNREVDQGINKLPHGTTIVGTTAPRAVPAVDRSSSISPRSILSPP